MPRTKVNTETKAKVTKKVETESEDEVTVEKVRDRDDSSDFESENEANDGLSEKSEESADESVKSDSEDERVKPKKGKETFEELSKKLEILRSDIKIVDKEIVELSKTLKTKERLRNEHERQVNVILKQLTKTHSDEVNKARKEKPKRKGNTTGGFNKEHPVPETLCKFLELDEGTMMARPKVMSAMNNKFTDLGLKKGQETILDKSTAKALGLGKESEGRVIKFGEFQTFLASFYPKKETKV